MPNPTADSPEQIAWNNNGHQALDLADMRAELARPGLSPQARQLLQMYANEKQGGAPVPQVPARNMRDGFPELRGQTDAPASTPASASAFTQAPKGPWSDLINAAGGRSASAQPGAAAPSDAPPSMGMWDSKYDAPKPDLTPKEGAFARAARVASDPNGGLLAGAGSLVDSVLSGNRDTPSDTRGVTGFLADTGRAAVQGVIGGVADAAGLGSFLTGGWLGEQAKKLGFAPEAANQMIQGFKTLPTQQAQQNVDEAHGFVNKVAALVVNPSVIFDNFVQSVPGMAAAMATGGAAELGVFTRAVMPHALEAAEAAGLTGKIAEKFTADYLAGVAKIAPEVAAGARAAGTAANTAAGAAVFGAQTTGAVTNAGQNAGQDWSTYAPAAAAAGLATAATIFAGKAVSNAIGAGDIYSLKAGTGGVLARAGKEAAKQGLENATMGATSQMGTNVATAKPMMDNVGDAAAGAAVMGAGLGLIHGALHSAPPAGKPSADPIAVLDAGDQKLDAANNAFGAAVTEWKKQPPAEVVVDTISKQPTVEAGIAAMNAAAAAPSALLGSIVEGRDANDRARAAALAPLMDRQAELTAQQAAAGTEAERQGLAAQAATGLEQGTSATPANGFADLSPMDQRTAQGRLKVLRDQDAGDPLANPAGLQIVPHPNTPGKFAISKGEPLPSLDLPKAPGAPAAEVQHRIETAALTGTEAARKAEDAPRQSILNRVFQNIKDRNGVASPQEARILQEANLGRPFNRVDVSLSTDPRLTTDQKLQQATGVIPGTESNTKSSEALGGPAAARGEAAAVATEQTARGDSRMAQLAREKAAGLAARDAAAAETARAAAPPPAADVIAAARVPEGERNQSQRTTMDQARTRYAPNDFRILENAGKAPFTLGGADRTRLGELKQSEQRVQDSAETVHVEGDVSTKPAEGEQVAPKEDLRTAKRTDLSTLPDQSKAKPGEMSKQSHRFLKTLASLFGKKLNVFDGLTAKSADGFYDPAKPNEINLNRNSQQAHLVVFGHELLHSLRGDSPAAYDAIMKVMKIRAESDADFKNTKGIKGNHEEAIADLQGNLFGKTDFWADVFREVMKGTEDKAAATKVGATIMRVVNRFVKALGGLKGYDTEKMVENMGEVRTAMTKALADYANERRGEHVAEDAPEATVSPKGDMDATSPPSDTGPPRSKEYLDAQKGLGLGSPAPVVAGDPNRKPQKVDVPTKVDPGGPPSRPDVRAAAGLAARREMGDKFSEKRELPEGTAVSRTPSGFEAKDEDGNRVGYLKSNLTPEQSKRLGENASVDIVKADKGKGIGSALYSAWHDAHEGRVVPSGKTSPDAWKLWKREYPGKVDEFVKQEAARITDAQSSRQVLSGITDPEVRSRVAGEAQGVLLADKRESGPDPIRLEGIHYSKQPRTRLSSAYSGTSNPGAEAERGAVPRINFYVDKGQGIKPESGVGGYAHKADLKNLYDASTDAEYHKADSADNNDFEKRVTDAGYAGYYAHDFRTDQGAAALLGDHDIPVEQAGQGSRPPSGAAVERATRNDTGFRETIGAFKKQPGLPTGAVEASAWGERVKRANPGLYAEMDKAGLWDALAQQKGPLYKDEVSKQYKQLAMTPEDAPANASAMLNVGLNISEANGGGKLSEADVRAALEQRGLKVKDLTIQQSGTEPTAVVSLDRSMTEGELHGLSMDLKQDAIAQRHAEGGGILAGPKAADWGGAYNPDYFLHPDGKTDTEHSVNPVHASAKREELNPDVVQALGKHIRNLLPDERARLRKDTANKLVDIISSLPSSNEMAAVAYAGRAKRGWYAHSAAAIDHVFGPDGPRFAALLAALSPRQDVGSNLRNALKIWEDWTRSGRPTTPEEITEILDRQLRAGADGKAMDAWVNNSVRALGLDDPSRLEISGPKVNSFMKNLRGNVDEVTNDGWMAAYANVNAAIFGGRVRAADADAVGDVRGKSAGYMAMSAQTREAAKKLTKLTGEEWTPAEVQETIWSWTKTLAERGVEKGAAADFVKDKGLTEALIQSTPDFRTLFHDDINEQLLRDAGLGDRVDSLRGRADLGSPGAEERRAQGETAPFAADTQQRYEVGAARRLDAARARSAEEPVDVSESAKREVTDTPEFKKWFGDWDHPKANSSKFPKGLTPPSQVIGPDGRPQVVYHTTRANFDKFETGRPTINSTTFGDDATERHAIFATPDAAFSQEYGGEGEGKNTMPLYMDIKSPADLTNGVPNDVINAIVENSDLTRNDFYHVRPSDTWSLFDGDFGRKVVDALKAGGYDGAMLSELDGARESDHVSWAAFDPEQVKSALGNNGDFDATKPGINESTKRIVDDSDRDYTPGQRAAFERVGRTLEVPTLKEKFNALRENLGAKITQGLVDQFLPIKDLTTKGYLLARLSKGSPGALDAFLNHGKLSLKDGVYDADQTGGAIERVFAPLKNETGDFLWWVAANRAEALTAEDRERLFSGADIAELKALDKKTTDFDYTTRDGAVTRDRTVIYKDALKNFNEFHKNALDMAEQSGLIDPESRKVWEKEFYVPFNRVSEADGAFIGASVKNGLVRQQAIKMLKGGTDKLNSDLLQNTLMNWSHLIDSAAKNRAAKATLEAAANMGIATEAPKATIDSMGKAGGKATWFLDEGEKRHFIIDPERADVLAAINSLEDTGFRNPVMNALSTMKHWLTIGATSSPAFKIRHLIRGSMVAMAVSDASYNPIKNAIEGFKSSDPHTQSYVSALAGGGIFHFGSMLEGNTALNVRKLLARGTATEESILDSDHKVQAVLGRMKNAFDAYNEFSNRGEEMPRTALIKQLTDRGVSHADAMLQARDMLDYSLQGSWPMIRAITQVVPFMNARAQGMYKLGRAGVENKARMATVLGSLAMASVGLMAAQSGDEDFEKLDDSTRDNFWSFKFGGLMYHIPKPFELGALATLAERSVEMFLTPEMTKERFLKVVGATVGNQLNMNPIPHAIKPIMDLYANKDSFTGRPIETLGMEKLQPEYRYTANTSMVARAASTMLNAPLNATGLAGAGVHGPSPVQVDALVQGYFAWVGAAAVGAADMIARPLTDEPTRPTADYFKLATQGFATENPAQSSRYVTQLYEQAQALEQAYGTYHQLMKEGKTDDAREFADDHKEELQKYHSVEAVKQTEARINEQIRMIERGTLDPDVKKERIGLLKEQASRNAQRLAPV